MIAQQVANSRILFFAAVLICCVVRQFHAGSVQEFNALSRRCDGQLNAGDFKGAEQTAIKMRQLAESRLGRNSQAEAESLHLLARVSCQSYFQSLKHEEN